MILYKSIDICTKMCYFVDMNNENMDEIERMQIIKKVCDFLKMEVPNLENKTTEESVKHICVVRLCKAIGLSGVKNIKSDFFDFYSCIIGEAICEKLKIKLRIASDELRLVKYNQINLIDRAKQCLNNDFLEEAIIDTFELADEFKDVMYLIKNPSRN